MLKTLLGRLRTQSVKHVGVYTLANFLSRGLSFVFLPIFTYYISEGGFGILALINNSILFLNSFILFSVPVTLSAEYFKLDDKSYRSLFTSLFGYVIISTLISAAVIAIFFKQLESSFGFREYYIFLLPFLTFLNFFTEQLNNYLRIRNESMTFLVVNVLKAILETNIAFLLLYLLHNDYYSRIISITATSVMLGIYGMYYFFGKMKLYGKFDYRIILKEIPFGISIFIMQVGIVLMGASDKFFIKYFYTDDLTGIYNLASTLAAILFILSSSIMSYLTYNIYRVLNDHTIDGYATLKRQFFKYCLIMLAAAVLIFVGGTVTYYFLVKKTFLAGFEEFCLLIVGNFFWAIANFFFPVFWHYRTKRILVAISIVSIVISIPLYYFLIQYYSMMGAAVALVIIYLTMCVVFIHQGRRLILKRLPAKTHAEPADIPQLQ